MSARIFSPSDVVTHANVPEPPTSAARKRAQAPRRMGLLPGEVDTAVLGPARLVGPLRVERSTREHRQLIPVDAQPPQVVADRLGALLGQRQVVLLGAARIGVADQLRRPADLLEAVGVARQHRRGLGRQRRFVEVEEHSVQRALGRRRRRCLLLAAVPVDAVFILRAVVVALAGLLRGAGPLYAVLAARAFLVVRAGLALAGDAFLVGGAVSLAAAVSGDRLALARLACRARRAIVRIAALLALVGDAEFLGVAVLVGLARRIVGRAAGREQGDAEREHRQRLVARPRGARGAQVVRMPWHWGPPRRAKPYVPRVGLSNLDLGML